MSTHKKIINQIILTNLCISLVIPFNLVLDSKEILGEYISYKIFFSYINLFILINIIALIFFLLINFLTYKFNKKLNKFFLHLITFIFLWVFFVGIFIPVVGVHDSFLNLNYNIRLRYILLFKVVFVTFLVFYFEKSKYKKIFYKFISIYILMNFLYLFSYVIIFNKVQNYSKKIQFFGKNNLIVLSLDGISDLKMNKKIQSDEAFKNILKDFKFYKNVTASWPSTTNSLNAELNEKIFFSEQKLVDRLRNLRNKNSILNDKNFNTIVYGSYMRFVNNDDRIVFQSKYKNYGKSFEANIFFQRVVIGSLGRWGTPYLVNLSQKKIVYLSIFKNLMNLISFEFSNQHNPFNHNFYTENMLTMYEFDEIFDDTKYDKNLDNIIRMYHFNFSHYPVRLDENCNEVKELKIELYLQEEIAIECISKKIIKFLNVLKKEGIYNDSFVVIKSDHGKPNGYYKEYPYSLTINNSEHWGYGRYKPFILIKDKNRIKNEIEISSKHVFISDLANTYCNYLKDKKSCDQKFFGNNLSLDEKTFKKNKYEIYLPNKKHTFSKAEDFTKYEIFNDMSLLDSLKLNNIILN
jgi:hypothetical protein